MLFRIMLCKHGMINRRCEQFVLINQFDATNRNVSDGDKVKVFNERDV